MIKKRILVTGGSGKFGSQLCEALFMAGYEPCIVDHKTETYESIPLFGMIAEIDLLDTDSLTELMQKEKFSAVIHCAHLHDETDSFLKPDIYYENNFGGTLSLLKAMKAVGLSVMISLEHQSLQESPLRKSYEMSSQLVRDAEKAYGWKTAILHSGDVTSIVRTLGKTLE